MYPILFESGPITVYSLWFFIALGFIAASLLFVRLAQRSRLKLSLLSEHSLGLFLWTIFISRLSFIILHPDLYFYQPSFSKLFHLIAIWDKGLSFWGAVFAWAVGTWYITKYDGELRLRLFDVMVPSLFLGMAIGTIGAFLDGINYGIPTEAPWGMVFRSANVKYITAIHPTQLYSAVYLVILACGLYILFKKLRGRLPGFVTEVGFFSYGFLKFFEEFFRGDESVTLLGIRLPQAGGLVVCLGAAYFIYQRYTNRTGGDPDNVLYNWTMRLRKRFKKQPQQHCAEISATASRLQNEIE